MFEQGEYKLVAQASAFSLRQLDSTTVSNRDWKGIKRLLGEHHCKMIKKNSTTRKSQRGISHAKARRRKDY